MPTSPAPKPQSTRCCRDCKRPETEVSIPAGRKVCQGCRGFQTRHGHRYIDTEAVAAQARMLNAIVAAEQSTANESPPAPEAPPAEPEDPLESAYAARAKSRERVDANKQIKALVEENLRLKREVETFTEVATAPLTIITYDKRKEDRSDATVVVMASDWHVEEPVVKERVHGLNEFNLEIAKSRAEAFFRNTARLASIFAREQTIRDLCIEDLGDMFTGFIHEENLSNNLLQPADACIYYEDLFISGVKFLLQETDLNLIGDFLPGNHGRMTKKMWTNPVGTSLEKVAYRNIIRYFENEPRVNFRLAPQAMVYREFYEKFRVRMIHGWEVKYGGGIGGLTIPLNKYIARADRAIRADLTLLGHYHQRFDGGNFMVNGSLIGFNEYAQEHGFSPEPAQQQLFLIDARHGGEKTVVAPVFLD